MKHINKYLLCYSIIVLLAGILLPVNILMADSNAKASASPVGETYYTSVNMWYENPEKIPSTNYHKGSKLPLGTKVKIVDYGNRLIQFQPVGSPVTFTMVHQRRHTLITLQELFERYFSKKNILGKGSHFYNLTDKERENIMNGVISTGMCKTAVLLAYGYPPSHKTPLLSADEWKYWHSRFQRVVVYFENNKASKIERIDPVGPKYKHKKVESVSGE